MIHTCMHKGCHSSVVPGTLRCVQHNKHPVQDDDIPSRRESDIPMSQKYPKYYKDVPAGVACLDTYAINAMFPVEDPTGCIIHARKKLLVPGVRTGGKSLIDDVREARDTLTRFLQLHGEFKDQLK